VDDRIGIQACSLQLRTTELATFDSPCPIAVSVDLETEVEMKLPGRFKVSPQIAGAIKAVAGVVDVQTL
jgi:DNA polymerase III subunit alpha